jgi:hypothetical protein
MAVVLTVGWFSCRTARDWNWDLLELLFVPNYYKVKLYIGLSIAVARCTVGECVNWGVSITLTCIWGQGWPHLAHYVVGYIESETPLGLGPTFGSALTGWLFLHVCHVPATIIESNWIAFIDNVVHTRVIVLAQIDVQNSLQSMLEGSYKTGQ